MAKKSKDQSGRESFKSFKAMLGWVEPVDDEENFPRASGVLTHVGPAKALGRADVPAFNHALMELGVDALVGIKEDEGDFDFGQVMESVFDQRGRSLNCEALPDFFEKLGLGLDEPAMGGWTLAQMACWLGEGKLLAKIAGSIDLEQVDGGGRGLAELCAQYGSEKCLDILIQRGCDVDKPRGRDSLTPLMEAARSGHGGVVKLLANPARCAQVDSQGMSALSYACSRGRLDVAAVEMLCKMSDANLVDRFGKTPLLWSLEHGQCKPDRAGGGLPPFVPGRMDYCFQAVAACADLSLRSKDGVLPEEACSGWFSHVKGGSGIGAWMKSQRESLALDAGVDVPKKSKPGPRM